MRQARLPEVRSGDKQILVGGLPTGVTVRLYRAKGSGVFQRVTELTDNSSSTYPDNLPDGSVEAIVEGPKERIEDFIAWCRRGPPSAEVENVRVRWSAARGEFRTFMVAR